MNLAMNPERPRQVTDVAPQLEQWCALVETLAKYGSSYSLGLPFWVTALRIIMSHAGDWFGGWQKECSKPPEALDNDSYQKLYTRCEDWARKKRRDADTKNNDAKDIGRVGSSDETSNYEHGQLEDFNDGYYDGEGNWWSWSGGDINQVGKGTGKGKDPVPLCYRCGGCGRLAKECATKGVLQGERQR